MRASLFVLVFPLIGCGYDFGKFDHEQPASDSSVPIDSTLVDSALPDSGTRSDGADAGAEVNDATLDTFDAPSVDTNPQDTSLIGDVAGWPDAAGPCQEFVDTTKRRTYVICAPAPGSTPFTLARTYCTTHGMDVAYIDDDATNTFVYASLLAAGGAGQKAWIGLKFSDSSDDAGPDGGPYWLNHEPMAYTHWHVDSPGTNGTRWSDNCGDMYGGDGEWRDYFCTYTSFWFVCGPP